MKKILFLLFLLILFVGACGVFDDSAYEKLISSANEKRNNGDFQGAFEDLTKANEMNATDPDLFFSLSILKSDMGDPQGALGYINEALSISEEKRSFRVRAEIQYELGNFEEALKDADMALLLNDDEKENWMYYIRATIKIELGDLQGALKDIEKALAESEDMQVMADNALYYFLRSKIKYSMDDIKLALEDINKAFEIMELLSKQKKAEKVLVSGQILQCYTLRADIKRNLNDKEGAIEDLGKALNILQDSFSKNTQDLYFQDQIKDLYKKRAAIKYELGDENAALEDIERAKNINS